MKHFVLISLILSFVFDGIAQVNSNVDFASMSFVKKDTILLRWAPTSVKLLKSGLENGFIIERIDGFDQNNFERNPTLKTFILTPSIEKLKINSNSEKIKQYVSIIEAFTNDNSMKVEDQSYLFGVLLLTAGADKDLAQLLNLSFIDTSINNQTKYTYRISINAKEKRIFTTKVNAAILSKTSDFKSLIGKATHKRKEVFLQWNAKELQADYSAYWIERSTDSINFNKINKLPYFFFKSSDEKEKELIDYIDTSAVEGETYYYRVRGITHFGEPGGFSNIIKIKLKRILKGYVKIDTIFADRFERNIRGQYIPVNSKDEKILNEFILFKSDSISSGFKLVASQSSPSLQYDFKINSLVESGDRNFYKVGAVSIDNDTIFSFTRYFFTLDQIPPSQPKELTGVINDSGVVSLKWVANPEGDIRGYRIFKSNSLKEEFVEVSTELVKTTLYTDTLPLNTLTPEIYYKIAAVDLNYNNSPHSEAIKLNKPDTISPVACVFTKYSSKENGMLLSWNNSSSKDIESNQLIRRTEYGNEIVLAKWRDTTSLFVDTLAELGKKNQYYITTSDLSGNISISSPITVIYETGKRPSVKELKAEVDRVGKQISLSWKKIDEEIYCIKIYRIKDGGKYKLLKTIRDSSVEEFVDRDLYINNKYTYKVKVIYKSGISSLFSDEITVFY